MKRPQDQQAPDAAPRSNAGSVGPDGAGRTRLSCAADMPPPDDPELRALVAAIIRTCCGLLDPPEAEIVRRADILAQTIPEIARATGLKEAEVATRLTQARHNLIGLMVMALNPGPRK